MSVALRSTLTFRVRITRVLGLMGLLCPLVASAQRTTVPVASATGDTILLLRPDRVFLGSEDSTRTGWEVLVIGQRISAVGPAGTLKGSTGARVIDLKGTTLLPGLIEGHTHLFLHPYNETSWNDQVLREPLSLRTARAVNHAAATLNAGFTTARDLGTEGAGVADHGLKQAIAQGIIPGPRLLISSRALVATGSYGPKGFATEWAVPQGAEEADGVEGVTRAVRSQIGAGADWIKVYADYRWGPDGEARPSFTELELRTIVEVASSSGRRVVAHASTAEGMRRAILAGVSTIEHGDGGTPELWSMMAERGIGLCPTLGATEATSRYAGWREGTPPPSRVSQKRAMLQSAVSAGVPICVGGDAGVFAHGDNGWEMELMVAAGMTRSAVLRAATEGNARLLGLADRIGTVRAGLAADLVAVRGDPTQEISAVRRPVFVMLGGRTVRQP